MIDPDGTGLRQVTSGPDLDHCPRLSPDGRYLAWESLRHADAGDIYIAEARAPLRTQTRLTPYSGFRQPAWSPDGSRIIMSTTGAHDLWVIRRDGTGLRQLTSGPGHDTDPCWGRVSVPVATSGHSYR